MKKYILIAFNIIIFNLAAQTETYKVEKSILSTPGNQTYKVTKKSNSYSNPSKNVGIVDYSVLGKSVNNSQGSSYYQLGASMASHYNALKALKEEHDGWKQYEANVYSYTMYGTKLKKITTQTQQKIEEKCKNQGVRFNVIDKNEIKKTMKSFAKIELIFRTDKELKYLDYKTKVETSDGSIDSSAKEKVQKETSIVNHKTTDTDTILLNLGEKIHAKDIEVLDDHILFKKFNDIDGPTYNISKNEVFMIKYQNGNKYFINTNDEKTSEYTRKGTHIGVSLIPGFNDEFESYDSNFYFFGYVPTFNSGINFTYYFNNTIGFKSGIISERFGGHLSIGVPLKVVLTTGQKIGVYSELGFGPYLFLGNVFTNNNFRLNSEGTLGVNVNPNDFVNIHFGVSFQKNLNNHELSRKDFLFGFQTGLLFKLSK